ncbi:MAG: gamma subclass chorismate mutase AroQ [Burkholderiales bacterium]
MRGSPFRAILAALLFSLLAACATQPSTSDVEKIDRVLTLIQQRLAIADDVARNKWNSGAAIEDLPREREIIEGLSRQAAGYGLTADLAGDFFRAQIEASKIIQHARFRGWRAAGQPKFSQVRDLGKDIRPALDALTPQMMRALADAAPALQAPESQRLIAQRANAIVANHGDETARDTAIAPLLRIAGRR